MDTPPSSLNPWHLDVTAPNLILRGVVIYVFIIVLLRIAGKRQVGQMGIAEFVALLLVSNAVQNSMNAGDNSITGGLILSCVLITLSLLLEFITFRSARAARLVQGHPTLLIHHGNILHKNLKCEWLSLRELKQLLRKQGVHDIREVAEAVLEPDGYISITKKSELENHNGH